MSYAGHAAVRQFSPLAAFGADEPDELGAMGTVCSFARNETIFDEGEEMSASYKVVSGVVRLCRVTADGRRQIAGFRLPGDLIGVEWGGEYEMTAEAVRDVVAVRYARIRLERLSQERPAVRDHLLDHLRQDLRSAQEHLITLGRQTATERVASFLLSLARRAGATDGAVIDMQLGRQDIADYLGLTLETVSRTFSDLANQGVLASPKRRHVVIRNMAKLKARVFSAH
ncbi:MAG TPA: helix-turn-helix domain-containing protein [Rhizomicrobium sp.]|nr:helix-turn-helix domain-containing protein [Rhizomicrobium sp.]